MIAEGAVFVDRLISERLSSYIYIGSHPTKKEISDQDAGMHKVAQLLRAINTCAKDLKLYYTNLNPKNYPLQNIAPHFHKFVDEQKLDCHLQYTEQLHPDRTDRAVFKANMAVNGQTREVIVKFTYRYGKAGHKLLATAKLAPKLYFCEFDQDTMMHIIVMDFVVISAKGVIHEEKYSSSLQRAVNLLHAHDLVFGDLRPQNVLLDEGGIKLVDFDWCGPVGKMRYPGDINLDADMKWPPDVDRKVMITQDHDIYMLQQMLSLSES